MSFSRGRNAFPSSSPSSLSLGQFGGTFLLLNALSTKTSSLLGDTVSTIISGYEAHGIIGLLKSKEFKRLLKRYTWLVALALAFERVRYFLSWMSNIGGIGQYFFIDALLKPGDVAHDWILHYWESTHGFKDRSRDFVIETGPKAFATSSSNSFGGMAMGGIARARYSASKGYSVQPNGNLESAYYSAHGNEAVADVQTRVSPKDDDEQWVWHDKTLFRFRRYQRFMGSAVMGDTEPTSFISIRSFAFTRKPLLSLLNTARKQYEASLPNMVTVKILDSRGAWRKSANRHRRPLNSIIMDEEKRQRLLEDAKEFLSAENWYATRGIAWRRGYLLHGSPGTGKSSTIQALASEIKLDVYCVNINSGSMSDALLAATLRSVPPRSILVIEDIDATFSIERRQLEQQNKAAATFGASTSAAVLKGRRGPSQPMNGVLQNGMAGMYGGMGGSQLSLSGILNAIDGVESNEGRLLFMTTNASLDNLDPALIRPGRVDMFISYTRATRQQAIGLFKTFYTPSSVHEDSSSLPLDNPTNASSVSSSHPFEIASHITKSEISTMAKEWAENIQDGQFSVAELQGQLLKWKKDPEMAVRTMQEWVEEKVKEKEQMENSKTSTDEESDVERKADGTEVNRTRNGGTLPFWSKAKEINITNGH